MDTDFLFHTMGAIAPLALQLQERLKYNLREEQFDKKATILSPGETCRRLYFIKEGFTRAYYLSRSGKECTTWFMGTGQLMMSVFSFYSQRPASEWIQVLEPSTLQSISYQQLQAIYADFPEFNLSGRIMTEKYYLLSEQRAIMLRTTTPEERYEQLIESYPDIFEKASQKQVASYLGITHETLSRLRKKLP